MWRRLQRLALLGALAGLASTASSDPRGTPINTWVTGTAVRAVARAGDRLFVGGSFTSVYPASRFTGSVAAFAHGGETADPLAALSGEGASAATVVDDGAGGWFAGGRFARAGQTALSQSGPQVVHLRADGTAQPIAIERQSAGDWAVLAMARSGRTLLVAYVAYTYFGRIVAPAYYIAPFDAVTDARLAADMGVNGPVSSMVADSARVYVFGTFSQIAGAARLNGAALDAATLDVTPWVTSVPSVGEAEIDGTTLYLSVSGSPSLMAVTTTDGSRLPWAPSPPPCGVFAMAASPGAVYIARCVPGQPSTAQGFLTAVDPVSGASLGWSVPVEGYVGVLEVSGSRLYVGGGFSSIGGEARLNAAVFTNRVLDSWNPRPSDRVGSVAATADRVALGGRFTGLGAIPRPGLVEFSLTTGELTPWIPPGLTGVEIGALATDGRWLFVAGRVFPVTSSVANCESFPGVLALALDGTATIAAPQLGCVHSMAVSANHLFLAGPSGLTGINTRTGARLPWQVSDWIRKIAVTDSALYAVPYEPESAGHVWKFDAQTGQKLAWGPVATVGPIGAIAAAGPRLYVALASTHSTGSVLLSVDQATGAVVSEAPRSLVPTIDSYPQRSLFSPFVNPPYWAPSSALAASTHAVFWSSNGSVSGLQATGAPLPWSLALDGPAPTLYADDGVIVAGGDFATAGGVTSPGVAIFAELAPTAPTDLMATVAGPTVRFSWSPPSSGDAREYRLEAGSAPGTTNRGLLTLPPTPSYDVAGVPDGRYYVRVRALNARGAGPPSNEVEVRVGLPEPYAPAGLTATVEGRTVTLAWTAVAGPVDRYVLDVGASPGASDLLQGATLGPVTSARFEQVPPGVYYARLRALNRTGSSPPSGEVRIVVGAGQGG
jgi:hypothetical protein